MAVAELRAEAPTMATRLNPFRIYATALPPSVLLAAKIVTLAFLVMGQWRLTSPYAPFVGFLGEIASASAFQHTLQVVWLVAAACLFTNQLVRPSCLVLGGTLLLALLSAQPYRTNNLTFTALLLLMIGLSDRSTVKTLIRAQLVLLYFWSGMNKLLDVNWRTGEFFESWVGIHTYGPAYRHLANLLPSLVLSTMASWVVIVTELVIAATFLFRRLVPVGILLVVLYHSSLFLLTGTTFTMFWFSVTAAAIALIAWPSSAPTVQYAEAGRFARIAGILHRLDFGRAFRWECGSESGLRLASAGPHFGGGAALARVLLYHPSLYLILYGLAAIHQPQRRWAAVLALCAAMYAAVLLARSRLSARTQVPGEPPLADTP